DRLQHVHGHRPHRWDRVGDAAGDHVLVDALVVVDDALPAGLLPEQLGDPAVVAQVGGDVVGDGHHAGGIGAEAAQVGHRGQQVLDPGGGELDHSQRVAAPGQGGADGAIDQPGGVQRFGDLRVDD